MSQITRDEARDIMDKVSGETLILSKMLFRACGNDQIYKFHILATLVSGQLATCPNPEIKEKLKQFLNLVIEISQEEFTKNKDAIIDLAGVRDTYEKFSKTH